MFFVIKFCSTTSLRWFHIVVHINKKMNRKCFQMWIRLMSSKSARYLSCACYLFILVILEKTIRIPRSLSVKAAGILKGFLNKNPTDRLGCHKEARFMEIQTHPFFKSIEWEAVSFQKPFKQILLNLYGCALLYWYCNRYNGNIIWFSWKRGSVSLPLDHL